LIRSRERCCAHQEAAVVRSAARAVAVRCRLALISGATPKTCPTSRAGWSGRRLVVLCSPAARASTASPPVDRGVDLGDAVLRRAPALRARAAGRRAGECGSHGVRVRFPACRDGWWSVEDVPRAVGGLNTRPGPMRPACVLPGSSLLSTDTGQIKATGQIRGPKPLPKGCRYRARACPPERKGRRGPSQRPGRRKSCTRPALPRLTAGKAGRRGVALCGSNARRLGLQSRRPLHAPDPARAVGAGQAGMLRKPQHDLRGERSASALSARPGRSSSRRRVNYWGAAEVRHGRRLAVFSSGVAAARCCAFFTLFVSTALAVRPRHRRTTGTPRVRVARVTRPAANAGRDRPGESSGWVPRPLRLWKPQLALAWRVRSWQSTER
jgi:hypothetical protein